MCTRLYWLLLFARIMSLYYAGVHRRIQISDSRRPIMRPANIRSLADKRDTDSLPDLKSLFGKETATGTKYTLGGCEIDVAKDGCKISFEPKGDACKDTLSLSKLASHLLKSESMATVKNKLISLEVFQITKFNIDTCKGDVEFETNSKEPFDIIKEKLKVKKAKLKMEFNYKELAEGAFDFKKVGLEMKGEVEISGTKLQLSLHKKRDSDEGQFSIEADQIKVSDFLDTFKKKTDDEDSKDIGMFTDASIDKPVISGSRDVKGGYELVLKGTVKGIKGIGESTIFVIVQKSEGEAAAVGVVASIKEINPATILSAMTKKNFDNIPLIKDITADVAVEYANNDIMMLKDKALNTLLVKYIANAKTLAKGTKIKIELPIKKIIEKTGTTASLKDIPEKMFVMIFILDGKVSFKFPENAVMNIMNILVALIPKVPEILFEKIMKQPPQIRIDKFEVNVQTQAVNIKLTAPNKLSIGDKFILLDKASFELTHQPNGSWNFVIKATKTIAGASLDIEIKKIDEKFVLTAEVAELTTKQIAEHLGGGNSSSTILEKMKFLNFGVNSLSIKAEFGGKVTKLRVNGQPQLFDWDADFEAVIIDDKGEAKDDKENSRKMVFGIVVKKIRIDEIVKKFFDKTIGQTAWMNELTVAFFISNTDIKDNSDVSFTNSELKSRMKLKKKGVFFAATLTIPEDCKGDKLCDIAKDKMKAGTKLYLEGTVDEKGFMLEAGYSGNGIEIGKNFILQSVKFVLKVGTGGAEVYIEGSMKLKDPDLTFTGRLTLSATGQVEIKLTMLGMWVKPLGLNYVAFGNIQMAIGITPGVPIPKLEFSGEIHVGQLDSDKVIKAKVVVGFSPTNPTGNFFYAEFNKLTFDSLLGAFGVDTSGMPNALKNTGFPEGVVVGSSSDPAGKSIDHLKVKLEMGLMVKGMVDILGLQLRFKLIVNPPLKFELEAQMSAISIGGGFLSLRKSKDDVENGPMLYVKITPNMVAIKIKAYIELLGLAAETDIDISDKGMKLYVFGRLFGVVEANVTIKAPYGKGKLANSEFSVSACLSTAIADVTAESKKTINDGADKCEECLKEKDETVKSAASWYEKAVARLDKWTAKMEKLQEAVTRKSAKLDGIKENLDTKCSDQCKPECVGGFTKKEKCKKVLGVWVSCPEWDACKTKEISSICLAKCQGKKVYLKGKGLKKKVTMELLVNGVEIIQKILKVIKDFVEAAKGMIDAAEAASKKMEQVAEVGKKALDAIAKYTKENIINIHHICFNTTLEKASSACFGLSIDVTLGGTKKFTYSTQACLDTNFIKSIGKAIADQLFPGISAVKEKLASMKKYFSSAKEKAKELEKKAKDADNAENEAEGKMEEIDKEAAEGEDDDSQKKDQPFQPMNRSLEDIRRQIYTDLPTFTVRDDDVIDAFNRRSAWAFSRSDSPFTPYAGNDTDESEISGEDLELKENIPIEDLMRGTSNSTNRCKKTKATVNTYTKLSDTISFLMDKFKKQDDKYLSTAVSYVERIADLEKELLTNSQEVNLSREDTADALFYVGKLKDGVTTWMENLDMQRELQNKESLTMLRDSISSMARKQGIGLRKFLQLLNSASEDINKRFTISNRKHPFKEELTSASKIINGLLTDESGTLDSQRGEISNLALHSSYLKMAVRKMRCD